MITGSLGHSAVPGGHESTDLIVCPAPDTFATAHPKRAQKRDLVAAMRLEDASPEWTHADLAIANGPAAPRLTVPSFLHRFSMVPRRERSIRARHWRCPGGTGQTKEEFTMMGGFGNGMGSLGWLGIGVLLLVLVGVIVWLVVRPRDRN